MNPALPKPSPCVQGLGKWWYVCLVRSETGNFIYIEGRAG